MSFPWTLHGAFSYFPTTQLGAAEICWAETSWFTRRLRPPSLDEVDTSEKYVLQTEAGVKIPPSFTINHIYIYILTIYLPYIHHIFAIYHHLPFFLDSPVVGPGTPGVWCTASATQASGLVWQPRQLPYASGVLTFEQTKDAAFPWVQHLGRRETRGAVCVQLQVWQQPRWLPLSHDAKIIICALDHVSLCKAPHHCYTIIYTLVIITVVKNDGIV